MHWVGCFPRQRLAVFQGRSSSPRHSPRQASSGYRPAPRSASRSTARTRPVSGGTPVTAQRKKKKRQLTVRSADAAVRPAQPKAASMPVVVNAAVKPVSDLAEITGIAGVGRLKGNSLTFDATSGTLGGWQLSGAKVNLPRFWPGGASGRKSVGAPVTWLIASRMTSAIRRFG